MAKGKSGRRKGSAAKVKDVIFHGYNLTEMQKTGEVIPREVANRLSREEQLKMFEAIDKAYPEPSGVWAEYRVIKEGRNSIDIVFTSQRENAMTNGIHSNVIIRSPNPSAEQRSGALKYIVYHQQRPALEYSIMGRNDGYKQAFIFAKKTLQAFCSENNPNIELKVCKIGTSIGYLFPINYIHNNPYLCAKHIFFKE